MRISIILVSLLMTFFAKCQSKWTNCYYDDKNNYADHFIESYDKGYLIIGRHGASHPHFNWLVKTDINGAILWEKTFGEDNSYTAFSCLANGLNGELYLSGSTTFYDEMQDPLIMKLDSCGNKQWCKIFYYPGSLNYAFHILSTNDGGCVALLFSGHHNKNNRVCLARFNMIGDLLWKECYNSQDTSLWNPFGQSFIQTQDNGFLISGYCYYKDPNPPHYGWVKPYYIKADSLGVFEWEQVIHKDVGVEKGGSAWTTSINPSGSYYYSSISHYYPESSSPALLKIDLNGNVIDIYDLVDGYENGGLTYATFLNDSTLAAGIGWGNTEDDIINFAALIDTIGNIVDTTFLVQDIYTIYMDTVYDNKLLYMYNTFQNNQFDVYLRKLNYNLEDDTLYSFPFQYDTLCPYPIASDTIVQDDCGLIVGIQESLISTSKESEQMFIYPNPATDQINCQLSIVNCQLSILIIDIYGRQVEEIAVPKGQEEFQINLSSYPQGIYIAVLRDDKGVIGRKKFVVARP